MNKMLVATLCGLSLVVGVANAATAAPAVPASDKVCHEAWDHMRDSRPMIELAIKANDAKKVGELVIADHKYMEDFFAKNPQCKPKMHEMKEAMKADMKTEHAAIAAQQ